MNGLNVKATTQEDLQQILKLCTIYDQAIYGEVDTTVEDITNSWKCIDVSKSSYVVMKEEEIIAYGILTGSERQFPSAVLIHSNYMNQGIEQIIWSKLEGWAKELVSNSSCSNGTIVTQANNFYEEKMLEDAGFIPTRIWWMMGDYIKLLMKPLRSTEITHLGVRCSKRKQGLGLSLLNHAFSQLYEEGTLKVQLNVDSENIKGAPRVYEAAGMEVQSKFVRFDKEILAKGVYGM
ncbi:hypothetical protein IGK_02573 [Bacillus toyonensis]|nr:hypothetical protein IGK_02573 [Bacillus toyonensis]QWG93624.1 N-acetyltransferase [Bacillus toyonensis]